MINDRFSFRSSHTTHISSYHLRQQKEEDEERRRQGLGCCTRPSDATCFFPFIYLFFFVTDDDSSVSFLPANSLRMVGPPPTTTSRKNSSRSPSPWRYADLCQDSHQDDHYVGGRVAGHHRQRENQDSAQGGYPTQPAAFDFCRETVGGWTHLL